MLRNRSFGNKIAFFNFTVFHWTERELFFGCEGYLQVAHDAKIIGLGGKNFPELMKFFCRAYFRPLPLTAFAKSLKKH